MFPITKLEGQDGVAHRLKPFFVTPMATCLCPPSSAYPLWVAQDSPGLKIRGCCLPLKLLVAHLVFDPPYRGVPSGLIPTRSDTFCQHRGDHKIGWDMGSGIH